MIFAFLFLTSKCIPVADWSRTLKIVVVVVVNWIVRHNNGCMSSNLDGRPKQPRPNVPRPQQPRPWGRPQRQPWQPCSVPIVEKQRPPRPN